MLPLEFALDGPPVSYQSHNRQRLLDWQDRVREAAREQWTQTPVAFPLQITIIYFYGDDPIRLDGDNMAKPILDALNNLVYVDDQWVTDIVIRRRDRRWTFDVTALTPTLLIALQQENDCVYIQIEEISL
jgi:crossover junction endodeoxyribonuclease RusA